MAVVSYNSDFTKFEKSVDGHEVYADTRLSDDVLVIQYVYAAPALRGSGAASQFMEELMAIVEERGWQVRPVCGYAAQWLGRNSAYDYLLAQ